MFSNRPKHLELVTRKSKSESRTDVLLAAANCYKDRLNTLQTTEWHMYYAIWLVLLSSTYFMLTGSGPILAEFGEVLAELGWTKWPILLFRATAFLAVTYVFYSIIYHYYFKRFYKNNYESLVSARTLFEYYLHLAIHEAYVTPEIVDLGVPALRYVCTPKDSDSQLNICGRLCRVVADFFAAITHSSLSQNLGVAKGGVYINGPESLMNQIKKGNFTVKNDFLPHVLRQQSDNYSKSEIFLGRRQLIINFIIFSIFMEFVVGLIAPMQNDRRNDKILIEVSQSATR